MFLVFSTNGALMDQPCLRNPSEASHKVAGLNPGAGKGFYLVKYLFNCPCTVKTFLSLLFKQLIVQSIKFRVLHVIDSPHV